MLSPRFTCAPNMAYHIHITCLLVTAGGGGQGAVVFYKPTRSHITGYFQEHLRTFKDILVVTKPGVFWEPESHFYLYLLHLKQLFFKASCRQFQRFLWPNSHELFKGSRPSPSESVASKTAISRCKIHRVQLLHTLTSTGV